MSLRHLPHNWQRHIGWPTRGNAIPVPLEPGQRLLIFGDVHLMPDPTPRGVALARMLDGLDPHHTPVALCIGDLFEFWVGRRHAAAGEYKDTLDLLERTTARGIRLGFIPGNRDFLAGHELSNRGIRVLRGIVPLAVGGRRVWVCHGDQLALADRGYQQMRRLLTNQFSRWMANRFLPTPVLIGIGRTLRQASQASRNTDRKQWVYRPLPTVVAQRILNTPRGPDALVLGHYHHAEMRIVGIRGGHLFITGEWNDHGGKVLDITSSELGQALVFRLIHTDDF